MKVLLAGILGGVAMFIWSSIAHMALPLGEAGIQQISNEQPLLSAMSSTLPSHGMYMFPNMPPNNDQAELQRKVENGPSGLLVYFPKREFSFGKSLVIEFISETICATLAAYLLSLTVIATLGGRLGFYAVAGLLAVVGTNISYWNWYGFSTTYTAAYMFTIWFGFILAGLVASLVLKKKAA